MHFHPQSLKLVEGELKTLNETVKDKPLVIYEGFNNKENKIFDREGRFVISYFVI